MHPKAVTLALAGLMPFRFRVQPNFVRVMRPMFASYEWGLLYTDEWAYCTALHSHDYRAAEWGDIPPHLWDELPDDMLQQAIEGVRHAP
ncbi:hypothetical protein [Burkholderia cenocepacia]|uniref:hypothetical protein n=1 Tax=Burkholderia cenocepacia TaxID=95486 RepID=UPI00264E43B3|nr:hypothetical protein [Burkholderia cenocepacia]MDN7537046.1 hypothetical protein [Burkholderia cenocepacia]